MNAEKNSFTEENSTADGLYNHGMNWLTVYKIAPHRRGNLRSAIKWLRKAAFQGHRGAMEHLIYLYGAAEDEIYQDEVKEYAWRAILRAKGEDDGTIDEDLTPAVHLDEDVKKLVGKIVKNHPNVLN